MVLSLPSRWPPSAVDVDSSKQASAPLKSRSKKSRKDAEPSANVPQLSAPASVARTLVKIAPRIRHSDASRWQTASTLSEQQRRPNTASTISVAFRIATKWETASAKAPDKSLLDKFTHASKKCERGPLCNKSASIDSTRRTSIRVSPTPNSRNAIRSHREPQPITFSVKNTASTAARQADSVSMGQNVPEKKNSKRQTDSNEKCMNVFVARRTCPCECAAITASFGVDVIDLKRQ